MPPILRLTADALVLAIGFVVRIVPVSAASFPLGDGGLFLLMVQAVQRSNYALPVQVEYNGAAIPFAYPPLGFFISGFVADITGRTVQDVMQWLPLAISCGTLLVFRGLAHEILRTRTQTLVATFAFGVLPLAYRYFIMGAGITRSPGLLFAIATVWATLLLCSRRRPILIPVVSTLAALTILSHPNATVFAAYSCLLVIFFFGRQPKAFGYAMVAGLGALLAVTPWLAVTISRHGVAPFLGAALSGNPGAPAWTLFLGMRISEEQVPVLLFLAVLGVVVSARSRRWWLPVWLLSACVLDTRYAGTFAMIPIALLAGVAGGALRDALQPLSPSLAYRVIGSAAAIWLAGVCVAGSLNPNVEPRALPMSDINAMRWVAASTEADASFLVVVPTGPSAGSVSEWFPVLAHRASTGTYQGLEWLEATSGVSPWARYDVLQGCAGLGIECLDEWASQSNGAYTHVYIREAGTAPLRASLNASNSFVLRYRRSGIWIYARRPPASSRTHEVNREWAGNATHLGW